MNDKAAQQIVDEWTNHSDKLLQELTRLKEAVIKHHSQHADDLCWQDDDLLYKAFGLPPKNHSVGDKYAMLKNCMRFIERRCEGGGPWKNYAELETENKTLQEMVRDAHAACHSENMSCPWCEGHISSSEEWHNPECKWLKVEKVEGST